MKKIFNLLLLFLISFMLCGCTKQVVILDRNINTVKNDFDKYIKSTGYEYKLKDDENNIYNVHLMEYNAQFLLQSKPIISFDMGFTCKFKELGKDTLLNCKTYPSSTSQLTDVNRYLKEQKFDGIRYISYKKYLRNKGNL